MSALEGSEVHTNICRGHFDLLYPKPEGPRIMMRRMQLPPYELVDDRSGLPEGETVETAALSAQDHSGFSAAGAGDGAYVTLNSLLEGLPARDDASAWQSPQEQPGANNEIQAETRISGQMNGLTSSERQSLEPKDFPSGSIQLPKYNSVRRRAI